METIKSYKMRNKEIFSLVSLPSSWHSQSSTFPVLCSFLFFCTLPSLHLFMSLFTALHSSFVFLSEVSSFWLARSIWNGADWLVLFWKSTNNSDACMKISCPFKLSELSPPTISSLSLSVISWQNLVLKVEQIWVKQYWLRLEFSKALKGLRNTLPMT